MGICRISCSPGGVLLQVKSAVLVIHFKSNMQKIQELTFTLLHAHACSVSIARLSIRPICCCCRTPYNISQLGRLRWCDVISCTFTPCLQFRAIVVAFRFNLFCPAHWQRCLSFKPSTFSSFYFTSTMTIHSFIHLRRSFYCFKLSFKIWKFRTLHQNHHWHNVCIRFRNAFLSDRIEFSTSTGV